MCFYSTTPTPSSPSFMKMNIYRAQLFSSSFFFFFFFFFVSIDHYKKKELAIISLMMFVFGCKQNLTSKIASFLFLRLNFWVLAHDCDQVERKCDQKNGARARSEKFCDWHRKDFSSPVWLRSNLRRCTSEPTPHLHAHPAMFIEVTSAMHIQNKLFPQLGSRDVEFWNPWTQQHQRRPAEADQEIFAAPACPRWHLPRRSPPFIWLGPQPTQKCWQQWPTDELTQSRKRLLLPAWWRQTTTGLAFDSRMLKLKMKSRRGRAGRRGGGRVSTVDCARSPYGKSTFKRNRPSFAVLMVLGGGGGHIVLQP